MAFIVVARNVAPIMYAPNGQPRLSTLGTRRNRAPCRVGSLRHVALDRQSGAPDVRDNPGTPTWEHDGIVCAGDSYNSVAKLTFAKEASLPDPAKLFNSSLGWNTRPPIDIYEGEKVDAAAFEALIGPRSRSIHPADRQGEGERSSGARVLTDR